LAQKTYGAAEIRERHRHRYEFNNAHRPALEKAGLRISGTYPKGDLVEVIEIPGHPWFVACQFHPEFRSKPDVPHPLFRGFAQAARQHAQKS
jgi:CTP synthase